MPKVTYKDLGVSPDKPEVEAAISGLNKGLFPNAFCHITPDILASDTNYCNLMHADGVGTKSTIALLMHRETGRLDVFESLAQDSVVMNMDDLLCVGAVGPMLVSNTVGRNAKVFDRSMLRHLIKGYHIFGNKLTEYGASLQFCGGETADLGDVVRSVVIDSTVTTRMERNKVIDAGSIRAGLVIVGLASFGKATYEVSENSGIGTNGFTLVRHELLSPEYRELGSDCFDPDLEMRAFTGRYHLSDILPNALDTTIGDALLSTTRTYYPIVKRLLDEGKVKIFAMFHNTGGGVTKCLKFGRNIRYVKDNLFDMPPIFRLVCDAGGVSPREALRVLNLGQRFEIVCNPCDAEYVIEISELFGVAAKIIGHTEVAENAELSVEFAGETHRFFR